jgi:ABC-type multidrug transport system fused ATPase/permease subunit
MIGIPGYVAITLAFNKSLIHIHDEIRNDYEKIGTVRTESITNVRTVKSYVQESSQLRKLTKLLQLKLDHNMEWAKVANWMYFLRGIVYYGSEFLALTFGVYLVLKGQITLGSFVLVWSYVTRIYGPMNWIMRVYDNVLRQLRSVSRLYEALDEEPNVKDLPDAKNIKIQKGEIEFQDVRFAYSDGDGKKVIKGVTLKVPARKTVAIVGKSGSGKTTLAKLLMRFYDPTAGKIIIDGVDISHATQKSIRQNISYVLQDSLLFNDTVANNIRFSSPGKSMEAVKKAALVANADEFIKKLPKKYQTLVGERGVKLSGGEQQRVNIARAVLKNAPILVLDEATSSLDSESEMKIQDALNKLIKDKTTIIIAHRLSTVMRADLIVVMDKGKIAEIGTHEDLVTKHGGIYSKLYEIQSGGYLK